MKDFIKVNKIRNGIYGVRTYPGTDIESDHSPIIDTIWINLKFHL